jgi:hypothetical protein
MQITYMYPARACPVADDPYLRTVLDCAHEQKVHGLQWVGSIGIANKNAAFAMLVGLTKSLVFTQFGDPLHCKHTPMSRMAFKYR